MGSHFPEHTGRTAAGALTKARKREEAASGAPKAAAKPKAGPKPKAGQEGNASGAQGRGRGRGAKGGGKNANEFTKNGTPKKQILCKFVKESKPCPQGKACLFGHRCKNFDSAGQYIQR